jgi:hypothetical protein
MNHISLRFLITCTLIFLLAAALTSSASGAGASTNVDLGPLTMNYSKVPWPSPESLLQGMRAKDYETRGRALSLVGVPKTAEAASFDAPQEAEMRYAELGVDGTQQVIIGMRRDPMLYGAVAAQVDDRWYRIATFSCWCKYESGDLLSSFIQIESAPGVGEELVLRASGGGTGLYSQQQAHFRYHRGELHLTFTFVSHRRECDPTKPSCEVERRWFYVNYWDSVPGAVLVESRLTIFPGKDPEPELTSIRELELTHAQKFSCKTYKWDEEKFGYAPFVASSPCNPSTATK